MLNMMLLLFFSLFMALNAQDENPLPWPPRIDHVLKGQDLDFFLHGKDVDTHYKLLYQGEDANFKRDLNLLQLAVYEKDLRTVMQLVEKHKADVDKHQGYPPLYIVSQRGSSLIGKYLLEKKATIQAQYLKTVVQSYEKHKSIDLILLFIKRTYWSLSHTQREDFGKLVEKIDLPQNFKKALLLATKEGMVPFRKGNLTIPNLCKSPDAVKVYLSIRGKTMIFDYLFNKKSFYDTAFDLKNYEVVAEILLYACEFLAQRSGETNFISAEDPKVKEMFKRISQLSDDVKRKILTYSDTWGDTVLHKLAKLEQYTAEEDEEFLFNIVATMINNHPSDINIQNKYLQTPLHIAAQNGRISSVKFLVNNCKELHLAAQDVYGRTAMHIAAQNGFEGTMNVLLNAEEDSLKGITDSSLRGRLTSKEKKDITGKTPLAVAVFYKRPEVASLLIKKGADTNISINQIPLKEYAKKQGLKSVVEALKQGEGDSLEKKLEKLKEALEKLKNRLSNLASSLRELKKNLAT